MKEVYSIPQTSASDISVLCLESPLFKPFKDQTELLSFVGGVENVQHVKDQTVEGVHHFKNQTVYSVLYRV